MDACRSLLLCLLGALLCGCGDKPTTTSRVPASAPPTEISELSADFSGENAYVHCARICALGPRPTGSAAYQKQVAYLAEYLRRVGWRPVAQPFSPLPGRSMMNVHATYGASTSTRPLIISCHIDTKGQGKDAILGADDGASGAAVILELARVLAHHPELAARVEFVFFDGEEALGKHITPQDGLYGSRYDVQRRGSDLPERLINLDMVGGAGKLIAVPLMDTSASMLDHYAQAIQTLHLPEDHWSLYYGSYWDDHRPFLEAGVETLNLIADFSSSSWWHTSRDDMSRISSLSLADTGRLVLQLLRQILESH